MDNGTTIKDTKIKRCLKIFVSCLYISAFTFGGGYTIIALLRKKFVDELKWIDQKEMMNLVAVAQSSPGAMAVNTAVLVGYKIGGVLGAFFAMLGTIIPPIVIITVVSFIYKYIIENQLVLAILKGMQAGIGAIICDVVITMATQFYRGNKWKSVLNTGIMVLSFCLIFILGINPLYIICGCIVVGIIVFLVGLKLKKKSDDANTEGDV